MDCRSLQPRNALAGRQLLSLQWTRKTKTRSPDHRIHREKSGKNESLGICPLQASQTCQKRGHGAHHDSAPDNNTTPLRAPTGHGPLPVPLSAYFPGFKPDTVWTPEIKFKRRSDDVAEEGRRALLLEPTQGRRVTLIVLQ